MKRKARKAGKKATVDLARLAVAAAAFLLLLFFAKRQDILTILPQPGQDTDTETDTADAGVPINPVSTDGSLSVHYIDVGQGDSALIVAPDGSAMLIDAGPNSAEDELSAYLDELGIKEFTYVVFTHPHEDHIGGGDMIMKEYAVERVIMPRAVSTSATFERLIGAIEASTAEVIAADDMLGESLTLGEGDAAAEFMILGPCDDYSDLNNASVVLRMRYGDASFLFTGDAEKESESDQLARFKSNLKVDVLKVGHHGSVTSTSDSYLDAVAPQIAVISCAKVNEYGHPHRETIEKLTSAGAVIYTTADFGSIVIRTDGKSIEAVTK